MELFSHLNSSFESDNFFFLDEKFKKIFISFLKVVGEKMEIFIQREEKRNSYRMRNSGKMKTLLGRINLITRPE